VNLGFADASAVIAGGTRGIGLATAVCLAEHGARVAIIGRDEGRLADAATTVAAAGSPEVLTLGADLGSASDVDAVF
jgi:3-oxoacyl-[acyl-carrier protein] reductase